MAETEDAHKGGAEVEGKWARWDGCGPLRRG